MESKHGFLLAERAARILGLEPITLRTMVRNDMVPGYVTKKGKRKRAAYLVSAAWVAELLDKITPVARDAKAGNEALSGMIGILKELLKPQDADFMIARLRGRTLEEIAAERNVTRQRAFQIQLRIILALQEDWDWIRHAFSKNGVYDLGNKVAFIDTVSGRERRRSNVG